MRVLQAMRVFLSEFFEPRSQFLVNYHINTISYYLTLIQNLLSCKNPKSLSEWSQIKISHSALTKILALIKILLSIKSTISQRAFIKLRSFFKRILKSEKSLQHVSSIFPNSPCEA